MKYFWVDVSTDATMPMKDRKRTTTICRRGNADESYLPTRAEWRKLRQLATWLARRNWPTPAEGVVYWRVRAMDSDRTLSCVSAVKRLIVDGGEWTVSDVDFSAQSPSVTWTHVGEGLVKYSLEFSVDSNFVPGARTTLKVPARSTTGSSYEFTTADLRRLSTFAARNGLAELQYRVRGEDADRQFICYSDSKATPTP